VATKLVLSEYGATREIAVINAYIEQEHTDNRRKVFAPRPAAE